jgi:hypothetical protein
VLPFVHDRLQRLQALLACSSVVIAKYNRLDLDLAAAVNAFLDETVAAYSALQLATAENTLLALKAQFVSAEQGTHPDTLERNTGHRRQLVRAIALRVLQRSAEQLRNDITQDQNRLYDATRQLQPLVLLAIRDKLLPPLRRQRLNQHQLQQLWRALLQASESELAARQLAMQTSTYDILLLLDDLLQSAAALPKLLAAAQGST